MKNLTHFCKTVETGMDPRLLFRRRKLISSSSLLSAPLSSPLLFLTNK